MDTREEARAEALNKEILSIVEGLVGSDITSGTQLSKVGFPLIRGFRGVFAADTVPDLASGESAIINTDPQGAPGTHWMALRRTPKNTLHYDSYGRTGSKVSHRLAGRGLVDADMDAEQTGKETNCGARSLAWLMLCDRWSPELALLV